MDGPGCLSEVTARPIQSPRVRGVAHILFRHPAKRRQSVVPIGWASKSTSLTVAAQCGFSRETCRRPQATTGTLRPGRSRQSSATPDESPHLHDQVSRKLVLVVRCPATRSRHRPRLLLSSRSWFDLSASLLALCMDSHGRIEPEAEVPTQSFGLPGTARFAWKGSQVLVCLTSFPRGGAHGAPMSSVLLCLDNMDCRSVRSER